MLRLNNFDPSENPDWVYVYAFRLQESCVSRVLPFGARFDLSFSDPPRQLPLELHPLRPLRNLVHVHNHHGPGNLRRFAALTPSAVAANALARLMGREAPRQSDYFLLRIISTLCLDSGKQGGAWLNPTEWEPAIHAIVGLHELDHFHGQVHQRLSDEFARDLDNKTLHHGVIRPWSECFAMYRNAISVRCHHPLISAISLIYSPE